MIQASSKAYSASIYSGGVDKDGWPYVVRVYWSHVLKVRDIHLMLILQTLNFI